MKLVIDIPEDVFKRTVFYREFRDLNDCVITLKALEKAVSLEEELEKIKAKIQKEKCTVGCLPHIIKECNDSKSDREWCEYYFFLKVINERISEIKGEQE